MKYIALEKEVEQLPSKPEIKKDNKERKKEERIHTYFKRKEKGLCIICGKKIGFFRKRSNEVVCSSWACNHLRDKEEEYYKRQNV